MKSARGSHKRRFVIFCFEPPERLTINTQHDREQAHPDTRGELLFQIRQTLEDKV
jgi:hypothetical protein